MTSQLTTIIKAERKKKITMIKQTTKESNRLVVDEGQNEIRSKNKIGAIRL